MTTKPSMVGAVKSVTISTDNNVNPNQILKVIYAGLFNKYLQIEPS
jgi:hypothetical protein